MKLPLVSGREVVRVLERIGYYIERQRGSHIRLYHSDRTAVTVPDHYEIDRGMLRKILFDAGLSNEDFSNLL